MYRPIAVGRCLETILLFAFLVINISFVWPSFRGMEGGAVVHPSASPGGSSPPLRGQRGILTIGRKKRAKISLDFR